MNDILAILKRIIEYWSHFSAIKNFEDLNPANKIEGLKLIIGQAAGLATAPHTAGLKFFERKAAGTPNKALPTSPTNIFTNIQMWNLDTWSDAASALAGDTQAAERAVSRAKGFGQSMFGL